MAVKGIPLDFYINKKAKAAIAVNIYKEGIFLYYYVINRSAEISLKEIRKGT